MRTRYPPARPPRRLPTSPASARPATSRIERLNRPPSAAGHRLSANVRPTDFFGELQPLFLGYTHVRRKSGAARHGEGARREGQSGMPEGSARYGECAQEGRGGSGCRKGAGHGRRAGREDDADDSYLAQSSSLPRRPPNGYYFRRVNKDGACPGRVSSVAGRKR